MGHILCCHLSIQKIHIENPMRLSFRVQILPTNPQLSETSSEILRFVISVRYHLSETLWIFFTLSPHETMTFQQVPWFLDFICYFLFFRTSVRRLAVKFRDQHASSIQFFRRYDISFDPHYYKMSLHGRIKTHFYSLLKIGVSRGGYVTRP